MELLQLFQYTFVQKAFLAGSFVGVTCSALGLFLVLRKMSLIGDGLSHVSFGAIALGLFWGVAPFHVAIPIVILASFLILKISAKARLYGDAAIGIISAIGIASGVLLSSLSQGFSVDLFSYLFGNILTIETNEVFLSVALSFLVLTIIHFFYWDIFSATFDEEYAKTTGIKTVFIETLLTVLTAITVVLSVRVVGVMLVSALLILPAVTALQLSRRFKTALLVSCLSALLAVFGGIILSLLFDLPSGATIVLFGALLFALTLGYKKL